jgi:hypothetical protein
MPAAFVRVQPKPLFQSRRIAPKVGRRQEHVVHHYRRLEADDRLREIRHHHPP